MKLETPSRKISRAVAPAVPPGRKPLPRRAAPGLLATGLALALALGGCAAGLWGTEERYDNARALASTLHQPVGGTLEERTYRNSRYRKATFVGVRVRPPTLEAVPHDDPEYQEFLRELRQTLEAGTVQALASIRRLGPANPTAPAGPGVALVCTTEALVHVTPTGQAVGKDPVFRDPRPKLIVVYRLEDAGTGETVFRYTSVGISHWEYGPWAMEDLQTRALEIAAELHEALRKE